LIPGNANDLIEALAADAHPVRPLAAPLKRAAATLGAIFLLGGLALYLLGDVRQLLDRYSGREEMLAVEMGAILATGVLAVVGAFFLSIPGRSRRWLLAPLPPFAAWLLLSGAGCYKDFVSGTASALEVGHSMDCLAFIVAAGIALGAPLLWRLSRASPIDPIPVALLGGLGSAALAAFLLQFFHPFAVTFVDLAVHLAAIGLIVGAAALINRRALSPA
jgi:hypothetical protein